MGKGGHMGELPVDRGWSWVICFGSFICMLLLGTAPQALSVLFLELVTEFESSMTATSLSVMLYVISISVSSLVSTSVLVPRFGERRVIVVSSIFFSACSIGYSLSPNIGVFITFATLQGTSVGMIYVPAISLLSFYFNKRRSLATTVSNCGICVAVIVGPPFIRLLASEFGMRGAFLILAGVELHMAAAGLLLRPVSCYRNITRKKTDLTEVDESEAKATKDTSQLNDTDRSNSDNHTHNDTSEAEQKLLSSSEKSGGHQNLTNDASVAGSPHELGSFRERSRFYDRMDSRVSEIIVESPKASSFSEKDGPLSGTKPVLRHQTSRAESYRRQHSHPNYYGSDDWSGKHRKRSLAAHYGSLLSVTSGAEPATVGMSIQRVDEIVDEEEEEEGKAEDRGCGSCCFVKVLKRVFDPSLLNQWAFRVFLCGAVPSATTQYLLQYLPTISQVKGATKDEAATLLTIVGSVDLASRLALGIFADTHILRPTQICSFCQICLGILCQFNPLFNTFDTMIVMAVIMGLFIGTRQSLMPLMQIEIVGIERMSRCLSLTAMVATISAACHSPMLSAVMEATGSYSVVLHYLGVALMLGGVLIGSTSLVARLDEKLGRS